MSEVHMKKEENELDEITMTKRIKDQKFMNILLFIVFGVNTIISVINCFTEKPISISTYIMTGTYALYWLIVICVVIYQRHKKQ
jgi:heme A synthase